MEEAEEDRVIEGVIEGIPVIVHTEGLVAGELLYATYPAYFPLLFQGTGSRFLNCGEKFPRVRTFLCAFYEATAHPCNSTTDVYMVLFFLF